MKRTLFPASLIAGSALLLSACSGVGSLGAAESSTAGSKTSATSSAAASSGDAQTGGSGAAVPSASIVNNPDDRKDVTMNNCGGVKGGWTAGGKIANTRDKDADYTIVVSFTNKKSTVLARESTKVSVPAGGSVDWKVNAQFKAPKDVTCVLRGVDRA